MKIPRDYQVETIEKVFKELDAGTTKQLVVLATGMGKTYIGTNIINRFDRCLWITHTEELIEQSALAILREEPFWDESVEQSIIDAGGLINWKGRKPTVFDGLNINDSWNHIGVVKQERFDIDCPIVVASIQTLHRRLSKIDPSHFDCIIIDESHLAMAETWMKASRYFYPKLLLGLTATPERLDGISLGNLFDKMVVEYGIDYGINNGYLVELEGIRVKTEISLDTVRTTAGELNASDLEKIINTPMRNRFIVEKWKEHANGLKTLAFCVDMRHAIDLSQAFNDAGIRSTFIVSDEQLCPDRKQRISDFKNGKYDVVTNVMILTTGFDYPAAECVIAARPTKSKTIYLQGVGRVTRPVCSVNFPTVEERIEAIANSPKKKSIILDIVDSTRRHELVNTYTLDKDKETKDKTFMSREKKQDILDRKKAKEASQRKIEHTQDTDEKVNLIKLPKIKINNSERMREPATEKQLKWLKDLGYDVVNIIYTKRDCNEIISKSAAPEWKVRKIRELGYDVSDGVMLGQAEIILAKLEDKAKAHAAQNIVIGTIKLPFHDIM